MGSNLKRDVVIYIGGFELPDCNAAAQRVRANATLLSALGYKIVLAGRNAAPEVPCNGYRTANYPGIDFDCWEIGLPTGYHEWLRYILSVAALRELIEQNYKGRVHSIICYNFPAIAQLRVKVLSQQIGARAIADVTEWYQSLVLSSVSAAIKNMDTWFRMRLVNPRMDGLVTTSAYLTRYYAKWFNDIVELPTLIEHDPEDISGIQATPDGQPKRLFYGGSVINKRSLASGKGGLKDRLDWVIELLDVVKRNGTDFHFDIYGVSLEDYLEYLPSHKVLVERLEGSVIFHGLQPREVLLTAQRKADFSIFMRPAIRTTLAGFPTKFSESISFGTPVLTNPLENIQPYMHVGENCEIIDRGDFSASVSCILALLALPSEEVMRRKLACRSSAQFHPLSFLETARVLFPSQNGDPR